ncbi:hypothetical protein OMAG_000576 [Candidatus Omnitrophus magneticus]|nr:hypothetical protein OMAG_000576 [Candidatus Omnitrophus magneticus]
MSFQGNTLKIRHITRGQGLQFNIFYNNNGEIKTILGQTLNKGDWTLVLPGCVEYIANTGQLRFNDVSLTLSDKDIKNFNPTFSDNAQNKNMPPKTIMNNIPYIPVKINNEQYLIKTSKKLPNIKWLPSLPYADKKINLSSIYSSLSNDTPRMIIKIAGRYYKWALNKKYSSPRDIKILEKSESKNS